MDTLCSTAMFLNKAKNFLFVSLEHEAVQKEGYPFEKNVSRGRMFSLLLEVHHKWEDKPFLV